MSNTIVFANPGELDLRCLTTMGVNVKPATKSPIGFFGTGLKYAIAVLLRNNAVVTIHIGEKRFGVVAEDEIIRNAAFRTVHLRSDDGDSIPCGFTLDLGKQWELWHAFRELESNMRDENGIRGPASPRPGWTTIEVESPAFAAVVVRAHEYFLDSVPLWAGEQFEIHSGESQFWFYRGIRVGKMPRRAKYTYNILDKLALTEDRTLQNSYEGEYRLARALIHDVNKYELLKAILHVQGKDKTLESELSYGIYGKPSETFDAAVIALGDRKCATWARKHWADHAPLKERERLDGRKPSAMEQKLLDRSIAFLRRFDLDPSEYKIVLVNDLGEGTLGLADRTTETIFLSTTCLRKGTKIVCGTLLEEYLHLKNGWNDTTREMQDGLVDLVITMGELASGDPL